MGPDGVFDGLCHSGVLRRLLSGRHLAAHSGLSLIHILVKEECEATPGHKMGSYGFFKICVKVITPLCMLFILYGQVASFFGL